MLQILIFQIFDLKTDYFPGGVYAA